MEDSARLLTFAKARWRADADALGVEDAYKWLFHAARGGEHAVTDASGPQAWLDREWETLGKPRPGERLIDPLRPDGAIVRLNLRPYRAAGGGKDALLAAFVASAREFRADPAAFAAAWRALGAALPPYLARAEWERLDREASGGGYPAVHHSPAYQRARRPAYRVLTGARADRLREELARKGTGRG